LRDQATILIICEVGNQILSLNPGGFSSINRWGWVNFEDFSTF